MSHETKARQTADAHSPKCQEGKGSKKLLEALKQVATSKQTVVWDNCCRYPDTNK